jgi:hypothetical protein
VANTTAGDSASTVVRRLVVSQEVEEIVCSHEARSSLRRRQLPTGTQIRRVDMSVTPIEDHVLIVLANTSEHWAGQLNFKAAREKTI